MPLAPPRTCGIRYESRPLRAAVGVPAWFAQDRGQIRPAPGPSLIGFRDSAGFASMGAADFLEHGHLLESQGEPRLFDLRLRRDGRSLGLADHQGRFLPLSAELRRLLPDLPPDADEVRLMVDDGAEVMAAAAALATALWRPVWVTPGGAEVVRSAGDRLMARDRRSGQGVAWVQVMPEGWQAPVPPWYDTTSGMFEAPPGNAVALRLQRGPDDAACGALMARHEDYSEFAEVARRIQVSAGVFLVRLEIHSQDRVFSLDGLAPHPLNELPGILREQYGLGAGQDITLVPVYTAGLIHDDWVQLADDYDAIARAAAGSEARC